MRGKQWGGETEEKERRRGEKGKGRKGEET